MVNEKELDFIVQEGEGLKIEFKEGFDKSLAKEITAFANSKGGRIFLGVDDKGIIKGINITNKLKSQIQDLTRNCEPQIKVNLEEIKNVLVVDVFEGENKPYFCSMGFYLRQGPNSQKMNRNEIIDFVSEQNKTKFDQEITKEKSYDSDLIAHYLEKAGVEHKFDKNTLFNLGAANKQGFLNNAGVLFFTKNPKSVLINAYITCARYKGNEKVNVIDRKDLEGDLVSQVEQAVEFIKRNTKLGYEIKGLYRKDIPEYPIEAVREAVLNAVMHRDYFETGANVQIDIFDNRLIVTNIGALIKPLTKERLGEIAVRRNPLIADLFHRINLVEKIGTGINRIKQECKKHGNINFQAKTNGFFVAEFHLKKILKNVGRNVGRNVGKTERQNMILKRIDKGLFNQRNFAIELGVDNKTIERDVSDMKDKIEFIGPKKTGKWVRK